MEREKLLTPNQAAEMLGVSPITIRSWANKGLLSPSVTAGGHRRYALSMLNEFARQRGIALTPPRRAHRIMVIDDDESFGNMLVSYLRLRLPAAEVHFAGSGFEAGRMLSAFRPSVIMLDLLMPGMSGAQTCSMIRESDLDPAPRIIAMTGRQDEALEREVLEAGAHACMVKPLDIDRLIEQIEEQ